MTTSGTYSFTADRDMLLKGALRLVGALGQGETPTTAQLNEAAEALNLYAKFMSTKPGIPMYALKTRNIALVANNASYNINNVASTTDGKPLKVYACIVRHMANNIDTPMAPRSRTEYYENFSGKQSTGLPVNYYFEPGVNQAVLKVYPVPTDQIAIDYQIILVYQAPAQDFNVATDTPDFPAEWHDVIKYGLAIRLAGDYGLDRFARSQLKADYKEIFDQARGFDQEEVSLFIQPRTEAR